MVWEPIVTTSFANRLESKLEEISKIILSQTSLTTQGISVIGGLGSYSLFSAYYSRYHSNSVHYNSFSSSLDIIFNEINNGDLQPTFAGGLAGTGWLFEHLIQNKFIEADTEFILEELDIYLFNCMQAMFSLGNYDYLHGALGPLLYALSRSNSAIANQFNESALSYLKQISIEDENGGIKWIDKEILGDIKLGAVFNLGMAHGIPSIISLIAKSISKSSNHEKSKELLKNAVKYLREQRLPLDHFTSYYPTHVSDEKNNSSSRLAWCYGDLGIAFSFYNASKVLADKELESFAIEIFLHNTKRNDLENSMVKDAGICHGSAGIALIYNRMYMNTKMEEFREAAIFWLNITLELATFTDGLAGYKSWFTEAFGGWQNRYGLLDGIAGIGLVFLAAISDIEPKWDECLLIS